MAPLVIQPAAGVEATPANLARLAKQHAAVLHEATDTCGAVLFRGWNLSTTPDFEGTLQSLALQPTPFYGQAPRRKLDDGELLFRNIAFEGAKEADTLYAAAKRRLGVVWSWAPMFLNYHNEMAYLDEEHHLAEYGVFACQKAPAVGGYTLFADARRVLERVERSIEVPQSMKWVLTRRKRGEVPTKKTGSYVDFLLGDFLLADVDDQWGNEEQILRMAGELNLEVDNTDEEGDIVIWSKWISPVRRLPGGAGSSTWWFNSNHLVLGSTSHRDSLRFQFKYPDKSIRFGTWQDIYAIAVAYWRETTFFSWQSGDLIVFNNQAITHNASPGTGTRMILPSFGHMFGSGEKNE